MDDNPYKSPETSGQAIRPLVTAPPLAARVVSIVLFCLAAAAGTFSMGVHTVYSKRGLVPGDELIIWFLVYSGWIVVAILTGVGFLVLWLSSRPLKPIH